MPTTSAGNTQVESETELETTVLSISRRLLGTEQFGPTDNFFDAGGHSLLAMRLLFEIERLTGLTVPPDAVFQDLTVREFCRSLRTIKSPDTTDLLQIGPIAIRTLRSGNSPRTLYFVHAFYPSELIEQLSPELSLASISICDPEWLHQVMRGGGALRALDQISDAYAQANAARSNAGSYYLAAASFGGVLVVEMASRLEERGAGPDSIFLFDTYLHRAVHRTIYNILHNGLLTRKLQDFWQGRHPHFAHNAWLHLRHVLFPPSSAVTLQRQNQSEANFGHMLSVLRDRGSEAYNGPLRALRCSTILFRATETPNGRTIKRDPDLGWARPLAKNFTIIPTPGHHSDILKGRHANDVAREINHRIGLHDSTA